MDGQMCMNPECRKPAAMQCPTCIKLQLDASYFCSQECFKDLWPMHKLSHKKRDEKIESGFRYRGPMRPFPYSFVGKREVPDSIKKPDYAKTSMPNRSQSEAADKFTPIHTPEDIAKSRASCKIARGSIDAAHAAIAPGVTTEEIDSIVHNYIIEHNAYPSPLNYFKFPRSCCTSINEIICHGIPDTRPLQEGDIINVDVSCYYEGFHADMNETYIVGQGAESSRALVEATYDCLMKCIAYCKPGNMYKQLGNIIADHCEPLGFQVVKTYCGHGTGAMFHQAPSVPHYRGNKAVGFMKPGHIFTIEPMINMGTWKDVTWNDKWTSSTEDGQRSAQFEHTLLITEDGCEILTAQTADSLPLEHITQKPKEDSEMAKEEKKE